MLSFPNLFTVYPAKIHTFFLQLPIYVNLLFKERAGTKVCFPPLHLPIFENLHLPSRSAFPACIRYLPYVSFDGPLYVPVAAILVV